MTFSFKVLVNVLQWNGHVMVSFYLKNPVTYKGWALAPVKKKNKQTLFNTIS